MLLGLTAVTSQATAHGGRPGEQRPASVWSVSWRLGAGASHVGAVTCTECPGAEVVGLLDRDVSGVSSRQARGSRHRRSSILGAVVKRAAWCSAAGARGESAAGVFLQDQAEEQ